MTCTPLYADTINLRRPGASSTSTGGARQLYCSMLIDPDTRSHVRIFNNAEADWRTPICWRLPLAMVQAANHGCVHCLSIVTAISALEGLLILCFKVSPSSTGSYLGCTQAMPGLGDGSVIATGKANSIGNMSPLQIGITVDLRAGTCHCQDTPKVTGLTEILWVKPVTSFTCIACNTHMQSTSGPHYYMSSTHIGFALRKGVNRTRLCCPNG